MKAYYCVGTHWDREWYEPFQEYRMWLVELIDELMDLMERDPEYRCFHLDGQAVVIEDYLDIRPERKERFVKLLRDGRFVAGPWYDLPDEWLISGESYIRNLMKGMRTCRELGVEPMNYAYTPDQFGHIAALPMIMTGFGLKTGIVWRGTQDENYPAHFIWVGPDGSRMVTHKLLDRGSYGPFDFLARTPMKKEAFSDESFKKHFDPYFDAEKSRSGAPLVLMLDAIDHQRPDHEMPHLFNELKERYPSIEFTWGSLGDYGAELMKHAANLPERSGELREPARDMHRVGQYLIVHTISARYPIKRRNGQCQALLEKWAEPYALFQQLAGGAPIVRYLDKAWEYLLKNHPHDSICGCSIDQVHKDMHYRFDQCALIADGVIRRAIASVGKATDSLEHQRNLVLHNPLPFRRTGLVELDVPIPNDWPRAYIDGLCSAERIHKFALKRKNGAVVPFQIAGVSRAQDYRRLDADGRRRGYAPDVYHLTIDLDLPPAGYTGLHVEPTDDAVRNFGSLMTGRLSASNGAFTFHLNSDGTGRLEHPASGRAFDKLFIYEDSGDAGDGWTRGQLLNDIIFRSPGSRVTTAIDEDGPLRTVFRVEREFSLPRMQDRSTHWRSEDRTTLRVTDLIYVEKDSPCLRVRTSLTNTCMDHRFRVMFPTDIATEHSFAETPFAIVQRPIRIPADTGAWHERVNPETPFTTFCGVHDAAGGLALLAPFGPHEYEVTQTPDRSIALTLFRSTYRTVMTAGEPGGQLLEDMTFEYQLYPFAGAFDAVGAARLVAQAQTTVRSHFAAELPDDNSFVQLTEGRAIVSALKLAADGQGGVIRLWNPCAAEVHDTVSIARKLSAAFRCNLNEDTVEPAPLDANGAIPVRVPSHGLLTVRFLWQ
ncbi:MAG: hypothetical protein HZB26_19970 [Candidatus Hydrogenedentes bacterium]|nr:hypothetical protein [Candidatus Hydrogenedentota bacterium]